MSIAENKKPVAILIHGYEISKDLDRSTDMFKPYLEEKGYLVDFLDYRYIGKLGLRRDNLRLADELKDLIRGYRVLGHKVCIVGHSNGCTIAHLSSMTATKLESANFHVYFNPALREDLAPGKHVDACLVYHSIYDVPVKLSKWLSAIVPQSWFNSRPWGEMGRIGYTGSDNRVHNVDLNWLWAAVTAKPAVKFLHSTFFKPHIISYLGPSVSRAIQITTDVL
jgi:hypothetical protein